MSAIGDSAKLAALYAQIPAFTCLPGCTDCCGPVPFQRREWARVKDKRAAPDDRIDCPYECASGCAIYAQRPFMCRLFGATDEPRLTCPHGCGPAQKLSAAEAHRLTNAYLALFVGAL
jgi:hypothetical protein